MTKSNETLCNPEAAPVELSALLARDAITEGDVTRLRREVLGHGFVSREAAEALFALDAAPSAKCEGWTTLFVEAITDHVVWQARPTGIVSPRQGEWLLARADEASTPTRLAALVNVLAEAHMVPKLFLAGVKQRAAVWPGVEILALETASAA